MNKETWKKYYRDLRESRKPEGSELPIELVGRMLKELYEESYTEKQEAFKRLTHRYRNKLSKEYLKAAEEKIQSWKPEARQRAEEEFRCLIYSENPFLKLLQKPDISGRYIPVPISYEESRKS